MSWSEFATLLSGLNHKTPFGAVVWVRSETDPDVLKTFTKQQKQLRNEYRSRKARALIKNDPAKAKAQVREFQQLMAKMFSRKEG